MSIRESNSRIGIALSGGGVRAASFHAGVLQWLAEEGLFERVEHVSTVSGGSLLLGLMFQSSAYIWPTSKQYLEQVLPGIRALLTRKCLQRDFLYRLLLNPINWRFLLSRANVLANSIERLWNVSASIGQLPERPVWSINGTTAENGRRFRFKSGVIGDYEIGYADAGDFKLAEAMAVSAAFPGGIGPLRIDATRYQWRKREHWDSTMPERPVALNFEKIHLYDGGVYDNLGIETFFDIGKQAMKSEGSVSVDFLVVSDASSPYMRRPIPWALDPRRLLRVADMLLDQTRSLRVRSFVNFLQKNLRAGMYLQLGSDPCSCIDRYTGESAYELKRACTWLSAEDVSAAATYKTSLARMCNKDFDLICRNGYETALMNYLVFHRDGKSI